MASCPLPSVYTRFQLLIVTIMLLTTSSLVHSRGMSGLDDSCGSCYREIGRTVFETVTGQTDSETRSSGNRVDLQSEHDDHSSGLIALLMGTEGRQSREDLECSPCWVIAHRLKKRIEMSQGTNNLEDGFGSFGKRAMLNNGWVKK